MIPVYLKRGEERRLRMGHPWVYSNEIDTARSPLRNLAPGSPVEVRNARGDAVASGYVNPATLIAVRIVDRRPGVELDRALIEARLARALALREQLFPGPWYRLAFGESDALPGLVVDRYGDVLVAQIGTAGMERVREAILDALEQLLTPRAIVLRNDSPARALEGLPREVLVARGELPEEVEAREEGARFLVDPLEGQKTGWYYDQRSNRVLLPRLLASAGPGGGEGAGEEGADRTRALPLEGMRVLDLFCYTGGWGIQAARHGASEVLGLDSSERALAQAARNVERNGVADRVRVQRADVVQALKELRSRGERFDVVVVDPPAFVRRRKDLQAGVEAYRRVNGLAMQLVRDGGWLLSCSCSHHLTGARLLEVLGRVAWALGRHVRVVAQGHQDRDHPVLPALPETSYLKAFCLRVEDEQRPAKAEQGTP